MRVLLARVCLLLLFMAVSPHAWATTFADAELRCPICGTVNKYQVVASYGSYVYAMPSKFQFVFFPMTSENIFYTCGKCRLNCIVSDASSFPKDKVSKVRSVLGGIGRGASKSDDIGERLRIAEKVYRVLKRDTDDEFWSKFYRVMGYHLGEVEDTRGAAEARAKALKITLRMLGRKDNAGIRKELLLITGAMRHYLGNDKAAITDFRSALKLTYRNVKWSKRDNEGEDQYLTDLLKEYIAKIEKPGDGNGQ